MIADLPPTKFARLLDGIWKRRGWQTNVKARDNGSFLVMGRRENGTLGLLYVLPGAEREVDASTFSQFRGLAQKKGAQVAVVATQGSFVEQVRSGADEAGVHLLVLDEILYAADQGLIDEADVIDLIDSKPANLELVLTGSHAEPTYLLDAADLVTEVRKVKHPFDEGVRARKGTEY